MLPCPPSPPPSGRLKVGPGLLLPLPLLIRLLRAGLWGLGLGLGLRRLILGLRRQGLGLRRLGLGLEAWSGPQLPLSKLRLLPLPLLIRLLLELREGLSRAGLQLELELTTGLSQPGPGPGLAGDSGLAMPRL